MWPCHRQAVQLCFGCMAYPRVIPERVLEYSVKPYVDLPDLESEYM